MITDSDELCADLETTASALQWIARAELVGTANMDPMPAGLRDTLCALIERNRDLTERLVTCVEDMERQRKAG